MTRRLRIGLAGAGWVAGHHLAAYRALGDRVEVVAIADPSAEARTARAAEFAIPAVHTDTEAMIAAGGLDALDIAAPRETHAGLCRIAVAHGLAVLCQKPLAPTLAEAVALAAEIGPDARVMVHENWRFRPHYRRIRAVLDEGGLGQLRRVEMRAVTSGLIPDSSDTAPALRRQPMLATLDRLLVTEVLIHHLDTLRYLLGPLRSLGQIAGRTSDFVRGEDRASFLLAADGDVAVSLTGDFRAHGEPPLLSDALEIQGAARRLTFQDGIIAVTGQPAEPVDEALDYRLSYRNAIAHFLDCLASGAAFETSVAEHIETLRIAERAYPVG